MSQDSTTACLCKTDCCLLGRNFSGALRVGLTRSWSHWKFGWKKAVELDHQRRSWDVLPTQLLNANTHLYRRWYKKKDRKKLPGLSLPPPLSSIKAKLWRQLSNILVSSFTLLFSYFQTQPQESLHPMFSNTTRHLTSPYFQFISLP